MLEWDEAKRTANLGKHKVDFAIAERFDWETAVVWEDIRFDYGETRLAAAGVIQDRLHILIFTEREETCVSSAFGRRTTRRFVSMKRRKEKQNNAKRPPMPAVLDDNPEWTLKDFRRARPAREVVPEIVKAARRARGRPPLEKPRVPLTLRLDPDAIEAFRKTGPGWQSRINETLVRAAKKLRSA